MSLSPADARPKSGQLAPRETKTRRQVRFIANCGREVDPAIDCAYFGNRSCIVALACQSEPPVGVATL